MLMVFGSESFILFERLYMSFFLNVSVYYQTFYWFVLVFLTLYFIDFKFHVTYPNSSLIPHRFLYLLIFNFHCFITFYVRCLFYSVFYLSKFFVPSILLFQISYRVNSRFFSTLFSPLPLVLYTFFFFFSNKVPNSFAGSETLDYFLWLCV